MPIGAYPSIARELTSYWGSWPVSCPVTVGQIGTVVNGAFVRITDLKSINQIPKPQVINAPRDGSDVFSRNVHLHVEQKGEADSPVGEARLTITFSQDASVLIALHKPVYRQLGDIPMLRKQILSLVEEGIWDPDWIVVVEAVDAQEVTVLVSEGVGASIEFAVSADVSGLGLADLARADIGLTVRRRTAIGMEALCESGTPLYRTLRVKRSWLGKVRAELSADAPVPDEAFEDVVLYGSEV